jgi:hypothetical protein
MNEPTEQQQRPKATSEAIAKQRRNSYRITRLDFLMIDDASEVKNPRQRFHQAFIESLLERNSGKLTWREEDTLNEIFEYYFPEEVGGDQ